MERFPKITPEWKYSPSEYSIEEFIYLLEDTVHSIINNLENYGILLSGGIDSTILALLIKKYNPNVPCFTIGGARNNPDIVASMRLSEELNLNHYLYFPNREEKESINKKINTQEAGDDCVFGAFQFASKFVDNIVATEGIDELMGGYWLHRSREKYPNIETAFQHYWNNLESGHLTPMFEAAKLNKINIYWIYLYQNIVDYISRIPLSDRIENNIGKFFWKEVGRKIGAPEWVCQREKRGFVDAFS